MEMASPVEAGQAAAPVVAVTPSLSASSSDASCLTCTEAKSGSASPRSSVEGVSELKLDCVDEANLDVISISADDVPPLIVDGQLGEVVLPEGSDDSSAEGQLSAAEKWADMLECNPEDILNFTYEDIAGPINQISLPEPSFIPDCFPEDPMPENDLGEVMDWESLSLPDIYDFCPTAAEMTQRPRLGTKRKGWKAKIPDEPLLSGPIPMRARSKRARGMKNAWTSGFLTGFLEQAKCPKLSHLESLDFYSSAPSLSAGSSGTVVSCTNELSNGQVESQLLECGLSDGLTMNGVPYSGNRRGSPFTETGAIRRCSHCSTTKTPQWRAGPNGPKTLCNACGVRYKSGRLCAEYRPASSPEFEADKHSNSHRKIVEMRKVKEPGVPHAQEGGCATVARPPVAQRRIKKTALQPRKLHMKARQQQGLGQSQQPFLTDHDGADQQEEFFQLAGASDVEQQEQQQPLQLQLQLPQPQQPQQVQQQQQHQQPQQPQQQQAQQQQQTQQSQQQQQAQQSQQQAQQSQQQQAQQSQQQAQQSQQSQQQQQQQQKNNLPLPSSVSDGADTFSAAEDNAKDQPVSKISVRVLSDKNEADSSRLASLGSSTCLLELGAKGLAASLTEKFFPKCPGASMTPKKDFPAAAAAAADGALPLTKPEPTPTLGDRKCEPESVRVAEAPENTSVAQQSTTGTSLDPVMEAQTGGTSVSPVSQAAPQAAVLPKEAQVPVKRKAPAKASQGPQSQASATPTPPKPQNLLKLQKQKQARLQQKQARQQQMQEQVQGSPVQPRSSHAPHMMFYAPHSPMMFPQALPPVPFMHHHYQHYPSQQQLLLQQQHQMPAQQHLVIQRQVPPPQPVQQQPSAASACQNGQQVPASAGTPVKTVSPTASVVGSPCTPAVGSGVASSDITPGVSSVKKADPQTPGNEQVKQAEGAVMKAKVEPPRAPALSPMSEQKPAGDQERLREQLRRRQELGQSIRRQLDSSPGGAAGGGVPTKVDQDSDAAAETLPISVAFGHNSPAQVPSKVVRPAGAAPSGNVVRKIGPHLFRRSAASVKMPVTSVPVALPAEPKMEAPWEDLGSDRIFARGSVGVEA